MARGKELDRLCLPGLLLPLNPPPARLSPLPISLSYVKAVSHVNAIWTCRWSTAPEAAMETSSAILGFLKQQTKLQHFCIVQAAD